MDIPKSGNRASVFVSKTRILFDEDGAPASRCSEDELEFLEKNAFRLARAAVGGALMEGGARIVSLQFQPAREPPVESDAPFQGPSRRERRIGEAVFESVGIDDELIHARHQFERAPGAGSRIEVMPRIDPVERGIFAG